MDKKDLKTMSLWIFTSLYHDYAYFNKDWINKLRHINVLRSKYDLLQDSYDKPFQYMDGLSIRTDTKKYFSYTYEEIIKYYDYSIYYHRDSDKKKLDIDINKEKVDHGIVGGLKLFNNYCKQIESNYEKGLNPSILLEEIYKISCFNIASHNIFKSSSKKKDKDYIRFGLNDLLSNSEAKIKKDNGLLTLLSIVDTIECYKKFARTPNQNGSLYINTLLNGIDVDIKGNKIVINYDELVEYINTKNKENVRKILIDKLSKHIAGIENIREWTECNAKRISDWKVEISV